MFNKRVQLSGTTVELTSRWSRQYGGAYRRERFEIAVGG
jgi:hypothetical protein